MRVTTAQLQPPRQYLSAHAARHLAKAHFTPLHSFLALAFSKVFWSPLEQWPQPNNIHTMRLRNATLHCQLSCAYFSLITPIPCFSPMTLSHPPPIHPKPQPSWHAFSLNRIDGPASNVSCTCELPIAQKLCLYLPHPIPPLLQEHLHRRHRRHLLLSKNWSHPLAAPPPPPSPSLQQYR